MFRRLFLVATVAGIGLAPAALKAQYALGAGVTLPTGTWRDVAEPGWMIAMGYSPWRSAQGAVRLWAQGYLGRNGATAGNGPSTTTVMAGLGLSYKPFPSLRSPSPYLIGAGGVLLQQRANGSTAGGLYLGGGAGVSLGRQWLQARYQVARVHGAPFGFLLIAAGTSF